MNLYIIRWTFRILAICLGTAYFCGAAGLLLRSNDLVSVSEALEFYGGTLGQLFAGFFLVALDLGLWRLAAKDVHAVGNVLDRN